MSINIPVNECERRNPVIYIVKSLDEKKEVLCLVLHSWQYFCSERERERERKIHVIISLLITCLFMSYYPLNCKQNYLVHTQCVTKVIITLYVLLLSKLLPT